MKSKNDRQKNIIDRQNIQVVILISSCASKISMNLSMDIHIHGKLGIIWTKDIKNAYLC